MPFTSLPVIGSTRAGFFGLAAVLRSSDRCLAMHQGSEAVQDLIPPIAGPGVNLGERKNSLRGRAKTRCLPETAEHLPL